MSSQAKKTPADRRAARLLEQSRVALAEERNRAIEAINGVKGQMQQVIANHGAMRADMVRWVTAFMLKQGELKITFPVEFLKKADEWVLQRENDKVGNTITWRLLDKVKYLESEMAIQDAEETAEEQADG